MSMMAFFPWMKISDDINFEEFSLISSNSTFLYAQEKEKKAVDFILQRYLDRTNKPIKEFTIVLLKDKKVLKDLNENERNVLFSFGEIIAFSGLAARSYFCLEGYNNCDNYIFTIQGFGDETKGVTIVSRRRDGSQTSYYSSDAFSEKVPYHVNNEHNISLDNNLAKALILAQNSYAPLKWQYYSDALYSFNRANTDDGNKISVQQEIVLLIGAFQRLLEYTGSNKGKLASKFLKYFDSISKYDVQKSVRLSGPIKYKSIFEAWINDLYELRGDYAHGKRKSHKNQIWEPHEHLLLGAYLFPLLVKIKLATEGLYVLTDSDRFDLNIFERLADADLFTAPNDQRNSIDWEWHRIRGEMTNEQIAYQLVSELIEKEKGLKE